MQCRNCGTEIAEKAIVCYRCGTSTTDPVRKPALVRRRRSPLLSFVVAAILVLLALFLGQASLLAGGDARWRTAAGVLAVAAVVILLLRLVRRQ